MPTHIHADALTVLTVTGVLLFDLAVLKSLAIAMLAKYPESAIWQALAFIVGVGTR